jgi:ribonuclease E
MPGQPQDRQPAHEGPIEAASKPCEHRPERRIREDAVVSQGESARAEPRPDGSSAEASMTSERTAPIVHEAPASEPTAPSRHEATASEPTAPSRHEATASEPTATMPRPAPVAEAAPPRPADSSVGAGAHQHASEGGRRETKASADTDGRPTPRPEPVMPAPVAAVDSGADPIEPKSGT